MGRPVSIGLLVYSLKLLRTSFFGVILYAAKLSVGVTCQPIHANGLMADRLFPAVQALISPGSRYANIRYFIPAIRITLLRAEVIGKNRVLVGLVGRIAVVLVASNAALIAAKGIPAAWARGDPTHR
jgi:hypothetical protein